MHWKCLPILLLLVAFGILSWTRDLDASFASARGLSPRVDTTQMPLPVQLSELRQEPLVYLGQRVSFALQLDVPIEAWNPLLTRFGSEQWNAISGWSDDRFTWNKGVYEHPFAKLFYAPGGLAERLVDQARRFERFQVIGTVREVLFGEPWIEIERLEPLYELIDEGSILHVSRGLTFAKHNQLHLAKEQFERARSAPLPPLARTEVERMITLCD